jgi:cyclophilin family peptidyl-prolyl cis-trans isomerase
MKKILSLVLVAMFSMVAMNVNAQQTKKKVTAKRVATAKKAPDGKLVKNKTHSTIKDNSIKIKITTDSGVIVVKLYDSTPLHRDNFAKLVKEHFYDSLLFHRVISGFMIQGGDPLSKNAEPGAMLGNGGGDMARIPAEFKTSLFHKKGTLCAARDGNPEMASSACQFYIVQGNVYTDEQLNGFDMQRTVKYTPEQRMQYKTIGGTPMLDTKYTVFGEVISGLNVIDKIASVQKGQADRPVGDVRMKMEVVK